MHHWLLISKPVLVLVAGAAWWFRRHRFAPRSGLLGAQLFIAVVVEAYALHLAVLHQNNLWWYDLYVPLEFTLLLAYVHGHLVRPWQRQAVFPVWVILAAAYGLDLHATYPHGFVSRAYITGSLVLVAAFLALLYDMALRVDRALYQRPMFWSHLGMALFFSGMVPLLGLWNDLTEENRALSAKLYMANHVLFYLRYGSIIIACAVPHRQAATQGS